MRPEEGYRQVETIRKVGIAGVVKKQSFGMRERSTEAGNVSLSNPQRALKSAKNFLKIGNPPCGTHEGLGGQSQKVACCRFRGHRDKVFNGTGELECKEGSSAASSSLRR